MATDTAGQNKASSMAELMARQKTQPISLKRGDVIEGTITKLTRQEILIDINAKSEALVLERDRTLLNRMLNTLKVGDEIPVVILNPESDTGSPVVSLRRHIEGEAWQELEELQKKSEQVEVSVMDSTKGGYVVALQNGLSGFLPYSHTSFLPHQQPAIGSKLQVGILELSKQDNKIIFSQKSTISDDDFKQLMKSLSIGHKLSTTISNITSFGVFVILPIPADATKNVQQKTIAGLIHISEIAWDKVDDIAGLYKAGDTIEAVVIGFDRDAKRIDLSIKRLTADPFDEIIKEFPVDKKVSGTVTKVSDGNVHIALNENIEGIIRKEKVPPTTTFSVGQAVNVTISDIDKRRHRIGLAPVLLEKPIGYR